MFMESAYQITFNNGMNILNQKFNLAKINYSVNAYFEVKSHFLTLLA